MVKDKQYTKFQTLYFVKFQVQNQNLRISSKDKAMQKDKTVTLKDIQKHYQKLYSNHSKQKILYEDLEGNRLIELFFSKSIKQNQKHQKAQILELLKISQLVLIKQLEYLKEQIQKQKQKQTENTNNAQNMSLFHNARQLPLKILQLIRYLSKPMQNRSYLNKDLLLLLNDTLERSINNQQILLQVLSLHLRFLEQATFVQSINTERFSKILDLLVLNNQDVILLIIDIIKQLTERKKTQIMQQMWYVGRLIFALQRLDNQNKYRLVNLIRNLLFVKCFNQNFRRINGSTTLINQYRKSVHNQKLKLSLLNCIYDLLRTTKTQVIYDFKSSNFVHLLSLKLKEPLNYKQLVMSVKILTHLMLDNDISTKYIEDNTLQDAIILLVRTHPTNCHMIKFEDVQQKDQVQAFQQFTLFLLRFLRYNCSLQKNRKIYKKIFPPQLLGKFIDIGHFVKSIDSYKQCLKAYYNLENAQVLNIEDEYQKLAKILRNKNFKLQVVGNYSLVEQIGQGAFGCVYLAKKGNNEYALKRIQIPQMSTQQINEQFRQVKIYKELKHPNIIKFYQSFIEDDYMYIVMEVIKGTNLSQLIRNQSEKGQFFQQSIIWKLLICLLSVLRYMHNEKKVIHRDLNPSNIMVDHKLNLKVADFGLAKSITNSSQMTHSFVGTLVYSCPQIVQNQLYNQKADIWSLGCIVYQLMTLKAPFTGSNPLLLAKNIVNKQFTSLIPQKYSEDLKNIVNACLTKDQQQRPNVSQILKLSADKIIIYGDQLKEKQIGLTDEIVNMNKKINMGTGFGNTHTRMFGTSSYNPHQFQAKFNNTVTAPLDDPLRQTQLVKLDSDVISKIGQDPINKFIDIVKRLSLIASTQTALKKNFKKYIVDTFYNKIFISDEFHPSEVKNELQKLIQLSKDEVSFLGVKFQLQKNYIKSISYQMLYFYIEELYELIKKQ